MHIPDNYLSPSTCAVMGAVMLPIWTKSVKKVKREVSKRKMPILGVCAAVSFLIMMFNIPVPGGTTAHAVGAVLIAILIGPYAANISVTIALLIQALFFGDGGILAFGANAFNMAFAMPFVGYLVYKFIKNRIRSDRGEYIAAFLGGYVGIIVSALFTALELGIQPILFKDAAGSTIYCPYTLKVAIPAMILPHLLIGLLEGIVTAGVYAYIKKMAPEVIYEGKTTKKRPLYILILSMIILSPLGLIASGTAWGEWNASELKNSIGYVPKAIEYGFNFKGFIPKYGLNGVNQSIGYIISSIGGVAVIMIIFKILSSIKKEKALKNDKIEELS